MNKVISYSRLIIMSKIYGNRVYMKIMVDNNVSGGGKMKVEIIHTMYIRKGTL